PTPLMRDPLDGGVLGKLLGSLPGTPGGGDQELFRDPEDTSAPTTCEAVRAELSEFITTSAMINDDAENSGPPSTS
ncbi:MAG: hypothetical protein ACKPKO_26090, partial [Candidatus Fonsibacter sp.]